MAKDTTAKRANFNLDAIEDERSEADLFVATVGGRDIAFIDPKDVDWIDLANLGEDPLEFIELCVEDDDDRDYLLTYRMPARKADKLVEAFMRHYGLGGRRRGNRSASRR